MLFHPFLRDLLVHVAHAPLHVYELDLHLQAQLEQLRRDWRKRENWRLTAMVLIALALWSLGPWVWSLLPFAYQVASWLPNIEGIDPLVPLSSLVGTVALGWFAYRARREGAALREVEI